MKLVLQFGYLLVFLAGFGAVQGHQGHRHLVEDNATKFKKCGTRNPTQADVASQKWALEAYQLIPQTAAETSITVPVCFFVIRTDTGQLNLNNTRLQAQLDVLNQGFSATSCCNANKPWCKGECSITTGFVFEMAVMDSAGNVDNVTTPGVADPGACVVRIRNSTWAGGQDLENMKAYRRKGDGSTLNMFIVHEFGSDSIYYDPTTAGYAQFPWDYATRPATDGVVLDRVTLPGGTSSDYNGATAVHEVGHWLGLLHTFEGGCTTSDGVWDTAPEAEAYFGNCEGTSPRDSCPGNGPDPIYNFMDYSNDECLYSFTYGQKSVMQACWEIFRLETESPRPVITLKLNAPSTPVYMVSGEAQLYQLNLKGVSRDVTCRTLAAEGDADLTVLIADKANRGQRSSCCFSKQPQTSNEVCTLALRPKGRRLVRCLLSISCRNTLPCTVSPKKTLFALVEVFDSTPVQDFTISCGYSV